MRRTYSIEKKHTRRENEWKPKEWDEFQEKLKHLSLEEIQMLVKRVGIKFTGGTESVKDRPYVSAKEQLILVLDEADKEKLKEEYEKISANCPK